MQSITFAAVAWRGQRKQWTACLLSPLCGNNFHINATTSAAEIKFAKSGFVSGWRKLFIFVLLEATMKVG
jgi:hypothetical protein